MKHLSQLLIITSLLITFSQKSISQVINPVKWEISAKVINSDKAVIYFKAIVDEPWHIYAQDPNGGYNPTTFTFDESSNFERIGTVKDPAGFIHKKDELMEIEYNLYSHKVIFEQEIKINSESPFTITGNINFFSCDDAKCLPPKDEAFSIKITPVLNKKSDLKKVNTPKIVEKEETTTKVEKPIVKEIKEIAQEEVKKPEPKLASVEEEKEEEFSWFRLFIESFGGGLLALLTPCVYPIIPLTVSFFMRGGTENRGKVIMSGILFSLSIIFIYTSFGAIIGLSGLNLTSAASHWLANLIFFAVFIAFAFSFFGMFELTLPSSWANKVDSKADKGGLIGTFFMALATVIISFSCTGPIVGTLLGKSLQGEVLQPVVGMFAFGLAFSLPFPILAIFPHLMKKMPKSGGWMNGVKIFFAFLLVAFSMKFLSNLDTVLHWGIITREIYIAVWVVLTFLLGMYFLGKLKFSHDSDIPHVSIGRFFLALASFTFSLILITGLFGADLKSLSSVLPEKTTQSSFGGVQKTSSLTPLELCSSPKYADFLHLPHGLKGYYTIEEGLACAKEQNKPVFLDFKGHVCTNCKAMEQKVWSDPRVLKRLNENFIIIGLFNDDKTKLPENEWYTSKVDGKVKKTMGAQNSDYQVENFNINAYPYYAVIDHDENLLNEPVGYSPDIEAFINFLDEAVEKFNQ